MLIVGLGNPGTHYEDTRHNAGFQCVDALAKHFHLSSIPPKFSCLGYQGNMEGQAVRLLKPQKFMNLSGIAVSEWVRFYKIPLEDVLVIHDDIDLPLGTIKAKVGGGNGGHNGLRSLDAHIGNGYMRLRIGVDRPTTSQEVADYVLSRLPTDDAITLQHCYDRIIRHFPILLKKDLTGFLAAVKC